MRHWLWALMTVTVASLPAQAQLLGAPTALAVEQGLHDKLIDQLPEGATLHLALPQGTPERVAQIIQLEQDLASGQFGAKVQTMDGEDLILQGRFEARLSIPVPSRTLTPGERPQESDFNYIEMPLTAIGHNVVQDLDKILGQEIKRSLAAGRPVQSQSLREPRAVLRGERLTLIYYQGPLALSAKVKALEDAALDEPVRVLNLTSNKTITAIARGDGQVEILK